MEISIFKIFMIFGVVSGWARKALANGIVTLVEAVDLVDQLAGLLGIETELEIPTATYVPAPETEEEEPSTNENAGAGQSRPPPR